MMIPCPSCQRSFDDRKRLQRHLRERHGGVITCQICKNYHTAPSRTYQMKNHLEKEHRVKEGWQSFILREEGSENWQKQQLNIPSSTLPTERPPNVQLLQERSLDNREEPLEVDSWCELLERWGRTVTSPLRQQMSESEADLDDPPGLTLDVPTTPEPYVPMQKGTGNDLTYHPTPVHTTSSPPKTPASPKLTNFNLLPRKTPISRSPLELRQLPAKTCEDTHD